MLKTSRSAVVMLCLCVVLSESAIVTRASAAPRKCATKYPPIVGEVEQYLREQLPRTPRGSEQYYALIALEEALRAFKERNYGIGSITILKWKGTIYEFRGRNAMVTGYGLRDHAEARALDRAVVLLAQLKGKHVSSVAAGLRSSATRPDCCYRADTTFLKSLPDGLHVYGTLEPCPMCMVMMLNVGVKTSKSMAADGELKIVDGRHISTGAALATADKFKGAPQVWQWIRERQGLEFTIRQEDERLSELSRRIFEETRAGIDQSIGNGG